MHDAVQKGQLETVKFLLANGASPTTFTIAARETSLHFAAKNGYQEVVKCLVEHKSMNDAMNKRSGKDLSDGPTALHLAIEMGHYGIAKYLACKNVDLNLKAKGSSPLHLLAQKGNLETFKVLVEKGADISTTNYPDNETPLMIVARNDHFRK